MTIPMLMTSRPLPTPNSVGGTSPQRSFHLPHIKSALLRHGTSHIAELRQRNSRQPISRLPEDLLLRIFIICASSTIGQPDSELSFLLHRGRPSNLGAGNSTWSWVLLSYVCNAWRRAAISCQELWRYVDFSHPRWYSITLSRAKLQPLCIRAVVGRHNIQQLHRTLQLAHQIGTIHLDSSLHHIHALLDTLAHPNPTLRSMTIRVNTAGHGIQDKVYDEPSYPMIGPALPEMKYLELHSAPFYLVSGRYVSLTNLHLYDLTPCERPTLQRFLFALSRFSNLEHLTLDHAFPLMSSTVPFPRKCPSPSSSSSSSGSRSQSPLASSSPPRNRHGSPSPISPLNESRISLPHLLTLRLVGSITEVATVLDNLVLPRHVRLSCTITSLVDWQQSMWRLAQALGAHSWAATSSSCPMQTLVVSAIEQEAYTSAMAGMVQGVVHSSPCTTQGVRLRAFSAVSTDDKHRKNTSSPIQTPTLDLIIGPDPDPGFSSDEIIVRTLTTVWNSLALSQVHTLVLHDLDIITQKTWTQFLKSLPSLRVAEIAGYAPSGFVWALLLNAVACVQREAHERERREKREKKAQKVLKAAAKLNSPSAGADGDDSATTLSLSPPPSPLPPTSPLTPLSSISRKLFLPELTDVYLHDLDCSTGGYMMAPDAPVNSHYDLDDSRFLDVLFACLQTRAKASESSASLAERPPTPDLLSNKLRSLSIANCRHVSRRTALQIRDVVAHLIWDQRGTIKDDTDQTGELNITRYRKVGNGLRAGMGKESVRHYYRLKTLMEEE